MVRPTNVDNRNLFEVKDTAFNQMYQGRYQRYPIVFVHRFDNRSRIKCLSMLIWASVSDQDLKHMGLELMHFETMQTLAEGAD